MWESEAKTKTVEGEASELLERLNKERLEVKEGIQKLNEVNATARWIYEWVHWHFGEKRNGDT